MACCRSVLFYSYQKNNENPIFNILVLIKKCNHANNFFPYSIKFQFLLRFRLVSIPCHFHKVVSNHYISNLRSELQVL